MPTTIEVPHNVDPKDITAESGGSVMDGGVRVVIADGVSKSEVHKALNAISSVLISDSIELS